MDNDILPKTDEKRKPALGIIIFALLLICNVALFFLFLEIKTKIDEHNRILLTLPPDLQNQIIKILLKDTVPAAFTMFIIVGTDEPDCFLSFISYNAPCHWVSTVTTI